MKDQDEALALVRQWLAEAEAVVIGAGAGLSAAAGLRYDGERFTRQFADFIARYGLTDMYSAGFYPFPSEEERWAYWSRHILCNRYDAPVGQAYRDLLALVADKDYFVLTTNVDHQFQRAGFAPERIFATQGDYGLCQCQRACHDRLYDNEAMVRQMAAAQEACRIPSEMVPRCPVCGGPMAVNLRCDSSFVEDAAWHDARWRYSSFLQAYLESKLLFWELGVGLNTPGIIKYPFIRLTAQLPQARLISANLQPFPLPQALDGKALMLTAELGEMLAALRASI